MIRQNDPEKKNGNGIDPPVPQNKNMADHTVCQDPQRHKVQVAASVLPVDKEETDIEDHNGIDKPGIRVQGKCGRAERKADEQVDQLRQDIDQKNTVQAPDKEAVHIVFFCPEAPDQPVSGTEKEKGNEKIPDRHKHFQARLPECRRDIGCGCFQRQMVHHDQN